MSKETGLIPNSPFLDFIRQIRNLGTKVHNLFFTDSPKALSFETGTQFPKDGNNDQNLHFDGVSEVFRDSNQVIKYLHDIIDMDKSFDDFFAIKEKPLEKVELPEGGRLDGIVKQHKVFERKNEYQDYLNDNTKKSPVFNFEEAGFKNKVRGKKRKPEDRTEDKEISKWYFWELSFYLKGCYFNESIR